MAPRPIKEGVRREQSKDEKTALQPKSKGNRCRLETKNEMQSIPNKGSDKNAYKPRENLAYTSISFVSGAARDVAPSSPVLVRHSVPPRWRQRLLQYSPFVGARPFRLITAPSTAELFPSPCPI